uniref:Uncharacterized protein n=1 Tax=Helicoverpa armigera nucleopolyhedrovirus TaxID=51313 RepID=A0A0E3JB31_9ABAC|nr:hypothetical protein ORF-98 [Helicoverpa armigera nucleopolyhedrovirus]
MVLVINKNSAAVASIDSISNDRKEKRLCIWNLVVRYYIRNPRIQFMFKQRPGDEIIHNRHWTNILENCYMCETEKRRLLSYLSKLYKQYCVDQMQNVDVDELDKIWCTIDDLCNKCRF